MCGRPSGGRCRVFEPGLFALWLLCGAAPALGQSGPISAPASSKAETVTAEVIEARQKDAAKSKDLDDATRSKVLEFYRQAAEALTAADGFAKQAAESKSKSENALHAAADVKSEQKLVRESIDLSEAAGRAKRPDIRTVGALERELIEARTSLEPLLKRQAGLEKEPNRRANRRKEIRELLLAAQTDSRDLRKQLAAVTPKDEPSRSVSRGGRRFKRACSASTRKFPPCSKSWRGTRRRTPSNSCGSNAMCLAQQIALAEQRIKRLTEIPGQGPPSGSRTGRRRGPAHAGRGAAVAAVAWRPRTRGWPRNCSR